MSFLLSIMAALLLLPIAQMGPIHTEQGRLSVYAPGDGYNHGRLACGDQAFTHEQEHIAIRDWNRKGCGRAVLIYALDTKRWALASVRDAGPFGIYKIDGPGGLHRPRPGHWKVWTKQARPQTGWDFRAKTDLSIGLWRRLGKPQFLSRVQLYFLPFRLRTLKSSVEPQYISLRLLNVGPNCL